MAALKLLHLLCFVFWLGVDLGTFYASRFVADRSLGVPARVTALRIMMACDLAPRLAMPLTLATGWHLALAAGYVPLPPGLSAGSALAVWLLCGLWAAAAWVLHTAADPARVAALRRVDFAARVVLMVSIAGFALMAGAGFAAIVLPGWLALKLLCFALAIGCGLVIRLRLAPFGPAWVRLLREGPSGAVDAVIAASIAGCVPYVLVIWALLLISAASGVHLIMP